MPYRHYIKEGQFYNMKIVNRRQLRKKLTKDRNKKSTDEKLEKVMEELHELKCYVKDTRNGVERIWNYK